MQAAQVRAYEVGTVLYMVMQLSNSTWKVGFGNGAKLRRKSIEARDRKCLIAEVALAKTRLKLPEEAQVVCCFEAGRDRIEGGSDPEIGQTDHEPDIDFKASTIDKRNDQQNRGLTQRPS